MKKLPLNELIALLEPPRRAVAQAFVQEFSQTFFSLPGSTTKHQAWPGGYVAHLEETMNIARELFRTLQALRPLGFHESDALFTLFLHDTDKLLSYSIVNGKTERILSHYEAQQIFLRLIKKAHYVLTSEEENALRYVHGEGVDYHPTERVMQPLAAFIHCCDVISARVWYDYGIEHNAWNE